MARCSGIKSDGSACERIVSGQQEFCFAHDPSRSAERQRNAARAGRSRGSREIAGIKSLLEKLVEDVMSGKADKSRAAVAGQLVNARLRAIALELQIREQEEFESRITALEAME